ncbi:ABC transporter substrate-binding protein [Candidatus Woesearchaeota archaeon]|jgi:branched-chain amino acid transport system substrate-binding protein|nr:ABC transporter substrate-binding protein [Candidatus Woesearchaeota archaeon]MBT3538047.1 ABC transporter substrate-binding protein [Candidatus Woesearchaeota archaeon]MBT4697131.1 ABC transporter substrate-binding protein [Candidatus Woesearchaeota archaeon]MBT4717122.1 ABC transporter substrate-binding protein [Candidatus Woesearchaeota archaeon]MBT7105716.1 ABC transporter substrate-binding protein [Candidatus Woesearchaeota archaeon]
MKLKILAILLILVFLVGCGGQKINSEVVKADPIKIGWVGPLSGDVAAYGEPMRDATMLAVDEINSAGGINGRALEIIYEDGHCNPKDATTAVQKLINVDKVETMMVFCSPEVMGAAPIVEANKVVLFSSFAGSPEITKAGDYVFRNFPSDASTGKKMAELADSEKFGKVALLVEVNDYSMALKEVFKSKYNGDVVAEEMFNAEDSDVKTQLTKIKESGADAVYVLPLTPGKPALILQQFRELGIEIPILGNEVIVTSDMLDQNPELVEGVMFAEPAFDEKNPLFVDFKAKYNALFGEMTGLPPFYHSATYDAVYVLAEAMKLHGDDSEAIKNYLYTIRDRQGASGVLTMDVNGDPLFEYNVKVVKNGEIEVY